ncbi:hypothetical protein A8L34_18335 [Bacillus sp. FJAT-27264]|uniref:MFS transporter n=1 Tax=Paenibacillus sp. (strain DSM 101736 / FJAT-27264) TaxID=1850362 RepID=UPI000808183A|nr:MFS transporter [Bacillus sp. FJAT-27264]OBZ10549.1 hypothetical protein A8L34_18335 [Bacillus sp. FJAT-27264]
MLKRGYYGLLATISLSSLGDTFGLLAMEWLVYDLSRSKLAMGALALSFGIPEFILRLIGSPLSDRLHRTRFMASLAAVHLLAILVPLAMGLAGQLQLWHLFLAAGLNGACAALFMPTAMAVVPDVADTRKLVRAFAVIDGFKNAAALLGPAMAGALTAAAGALPSLGINAVCYTGAIVTLLWLPKIQTPVKNGSNLSWVRYIREITEGFSFYKNFPAMLAIMCIVAISNMCNIAVWTMIIPFVSDVLNRDAAAIGALTTAFALGTLVGLTIISFFGEIKQRQTVMLSSLMVIGLSTTLMGFAPSYPLVLAALFISGVAAPFFGSLSSSLHGRLVPSHLQGRVNSIRFLIGGSLQPIGGMGGAAIAHAYGLPILFLFAGLIPILCSGVAMLLPVLKGINGDLSVLEAKFRLKQHITTNKRDVPL